MTYDWRLCYVMLIDHYLQAVFSCFLQQLLSGGVINAFGVIYLEITEEFQASSNGAAWILAMQTAVQGLVGNYSINMA